ncbi:MAG: hypothetical protein MJE68_24810, partial [Proteobacteria bacterium]|nr:hypothetical protein [Pseudomonadota bacterium]
MQAKIYAKNNGNQTNFTSLEDISWLIEIDDFVQYYDESYYHNYNNVMIDGSYQFSSLLVAALIFSTFFWLNILILIFTMLNIDKVYTWLEEQCKSRKDIYKASAGVLTFFNLAAFSGDLTCLILLVNSLGGLFVIYITIKLILVTIIITLELLVSCHSTLKHNKKRLHGIMHALALCQIIWFGHRVATDAIISVIAFVIAPAQTLGTVTLLLSTVAFMILFVSTLLKQRSKCCSIAVFCTVLIAICTIGLIVTVTLLFIALVDHGLQSAGFGGFILSIVPSMTIFVIGLCVNRESIRHKFNIFANEEVSRAAD